MPKKKSVKPSLVPWNKGKHLTTKHKENIGKARHGIKFTEEHKRNISNAKRGCKISDEGRRHMREAALKRLPPTEETREKIRQSNIGRGITPKSRQKMRDSHLGHEVAPETRQKLSELNSGNRAYQYKDGKHVWSTAHPNLSRYKFRVLQERVKARDGNECILCHKGLSDGVILLTHHVVPVPVGYENLLCDDESNTVTLCFGCHGKVHNTRNRQDNWKKFLPKFKRYLSRFGYKELFLEKYL